MARRSRHGDDIRALRESIAASRPPVAEQSSGTYSYVSEDDPRRAWTAEQMCPDEVMNTVLGIAIRRGTFHQSDVSEEIAALLDIKLNTARAYVSGALLGLRQAGMVKYVGREGRYQIWEVIE